MTANRRAGPERLGHVVWAALIVALAVLLPGAAPPGAEQEDAKGAVDTIEGSRAQGLTIEAESLRRRYDLDSSRRALALYADALAIWDRLGEAAQAARTAQRMGEIEEGTGALERALAHYLEALSRSRTARDSALESGVLGDVGRVMVLLGEHEKGLERCLEALELARLEGAVDGEAKALDCLGEADYHRGDLATAIDFHLRARALWLALGDRSREAAALLNLGSIYSDLSEVEKAAAYNDEALALSRGLGDKRGEALALVALGRLRQRMGDFQAALNATREAMRLIEPMGDLTWQGSVRYGLGMVYERMGEAGPAIRYWTEALELFRRSGVRLAQADVLLSLGSLFLAGGDESAALDRLGRALKLSRELANPRLTVDALAYIGLAHAARGERDQALARYREALALLQPGEDRRTEAFILANVAKVHQELGDLDNARAYGLRSVELSRAARDRPGEANGLYILARLASAANELEEARGEVEASLKLAESLRLGVASRELRGSYLAAIQPRYELLIDLLMRLDGQRPGGAFAEAALAVSERARARSLLESLSEAGVDLRRGVAGDLLERERNLKRALDGATERLMRLSSTESDAALIEALEDEISALSRDYDQVQAEIRSQSPRYLTLTQPDPLDLVGIQQQVLDGETLLLEYSLGDARSYLWAVSGDDLVSYVLPPRAQIESVAHEVHTLLTARLGAAGETAGEHRLRVRTADARYWEAAERLAQLLLEPVVHQLAGRRLLIVADGALQYIPFGALPAPGRVEPVPLVIEHEVVSLPSASTLAVLRRETAGRSPAAGSVAVLADPVFEIDDPRVSVPFSSAGDGSQAVNGASEREPGVTRALRQLGLVEGERLSIPRLHATRREAAAIVAAAPPGTSFSALDFEASREMALSSRLAGYRIVHLATHGIVDSENPGLSGVVLSMVDAAGRPQNGYLRLQDIYNLELPIELVVLSACSSALGKEVRGEGLIGLVRGFMYTGASRVVASLWKVDDEATGELMSRFYRHMLGDGQSPAAALRRAQIEMWEQREWHAPFYWAAFVLQGEWQ